MGNSMVTFIFWKNNFNLQIWCYWGKWCKKGTKFITWFLAGIFPGVIEEGEYPFWLNIKNIALHEKLPKMLYKSYFFISELFHELPFSHTHWPQCHHIWVKLFFSKKEHHLLNFPSRLVMGWQISTLYSVPLSSYRQSTSQVYSEIIWRVLIGF